MKDVDGLKFDEYAKEARKVAIYPNIGSNLLYPVLGLCGESGEVAEKMKKVIRDDGGQVSEDRRAEMLKEAGDVLWYLWAISFELDSSLEEIALMNLEKLQSRANRGVLGGSGDNR